MKKTKRQRDRIVELLREVKALRQEVEALRLQVQWPGIVPYTIPLTTTNPVPPPCPPYIVTRVLEGTACEVRN